MLTCGVRGKDGKEAASWLPLPLVGGAAAAACRQAGAGAGRQEASVERSAAPYKRYSCGSVPEGVHAQQHSGELACFGLLLRRPVAFAPLLGCEPLLDAAVEHRINLKACKDMLLAGA